MTSVDVVWSEMEAASENGGSRRIDANYPQDAFCTLDSLGRRSLVLLGASEPDSLPVFDAMELTLAKRGDERISLSITLLSSPLSSAFVSLCDGLLIACQESTASELASHAINYLVHANSLLEYGDPQVLGAIALRGLLGELIVFDELLSFGKPKETVEAWMGPRKAPQDFVLTSRLIETKAKTPVSNKITISSIEQLDPVVDLPLVLAVVTITALQDTMNDGTSPAELVSHIRARLSVDAVARGEFDRRLRSANYFERPFYERMKFRLISKRYYEVRHSFPRLRQRDLAKGVVSASYDLDLSICAPFETLLENPWT